MNQKLSAKHRCTPFWSAFFAIAVLCGLNSPPSLASALYLGSATAELTITEITGGTSVGTTCSVCTSGDSFFIGNASDNSTGSATVNAADPSNLAVGDGLSLKVDAPGSASPTGFATGFFESVGDIDISNSELSPISVTFRLVWTLFADASIADPLNEDALSFASIMVEIGSQRELLVDRDVESDALFGPFGPQSRSDDFTFTVTLDGGTDDYVSVYLYAEGFADALAVPEPDVIPLFALGLAGLGFFARRRAA